MKPALYTASQIAAAAGKYPNWAHRLAARDGLRRRPQGGRVFYEPPQGLGSKLRAATADKYDPARLKRELVKCAAVLGFFLLLEKKPMWGREAVLEQVIREFGLLQKFSIRSLRTWIKRAEQRGLGGLCETRVGRCGRKAMNHAKPHAYRVTRAHEIAVHLQSGLLPPRIAKLMQLGEQTVKRDMKLLRNPLGYSLTYNASLRRWTVEPPKERTP